MQKHPVKAKAAAIKAATQGLPGLVFAAADSSVLEAAHSYQELNKLEFAEHVCADCGTHVKASAHTPEPYCVVCGSDKVTATGAKVTASLKSDDELVAVQCGQCKTPNVLEARVVKAAKHSFHCACCGTHLKASAEAPQPGIEPGKLENESMAPTEMKDHSDPEAVNQVTAEGETLVDDIAEDDFGGDLDDALDDDSIEDAAMEDMDSTGDAGDWTMADDTEQANGMQDQLLVAPDFLEAPTDGLVDQDNGTVGEEFRVETETDCAEPDLCFDDLEGEPLLAVASLDDTASKLHFVQAGTRVIAMKGQYAVATLTREQAGKNADLFGTDALMQAVHHQAAANGLRKALASFGFKAVRVPAPEKAAVSRQVASVQAKAAEQAKAAQKLQAETMALAAAGLARNLWGQRAPNPLRAALETELSRYGVRNARSVVASLLAKHGVEYSKALVVTATRLQGMSATARREFAEMLDMATDAPIQDIMPMGEEDPVISDADEMPMNDYSEDVFDAPIDAPEAVMSRLVTPTQRSTQTAALLKPRANASAEAMSRAQQILSGTAGLGFDDL